MARVTFDKLGIRADFGDDGCVIEYRDQAGSWRRSRFTVADAHRHTGKASILVRADQATCLAQACFRWVWGFRILALAMIVFGSVSMESPALSATTVLSIAYVLLVCALLFAARVVQRVHPEAGLLGVALSSIALGTVAAADAYMPDRVIQALWPMAVVAIAVAASAFFQAERNQAVDAATRLLEKATRPPRL